MSTKFPNSKFSVRNSIIKNDNEVNKILINLKVNFDRRNS